MTNLGPRSSEGHDENGQREQTMQPKVNTDELTEESQKTKTLESAPAPVFRARKRARKARHRRPREEQSDHGESDDDGTEVSKTDLLLIKQVQMMREKSRTSALDITLAGSKRSSSDNQQGSTKRNNNADVGLRNNFAVERSNQLIDEQMNKYIDEGIRKKFGDHREQEKDASKSHEPEEEALYNIPENLRVEDRLQYDPAQGMPTAGVEEVELPEAVRLKNEMDTIVAQKKLEEQSAKRGLESTVCDPRMADENQEHVRPASPSTARKHGSTKRISQSFEKREAELHHMQRTSSKDGKKRRFQQATDKIVADRFRKRWRR
ncbi:hypothetical protein BWQ96_09433 [Gracilariopsis chorda]|uniref:Uncharacterized protein n=1 Tax=Gracilariopsis chorda TaxID=448386 RepID=A0A2V3IFN2_9FLOR|nr:hypothetical protein BWQ96_09433 [Gracilariopsis chorda]|eukprot:PXF40843.1 hypothetical protein BWQ96_09433 [Gracilariopsis chorda]